LKNTQIYTEKHTGK
jgi:hypothetical protein